MDALSAPVFPELNAAKAAPTVDTKDVTKARQAAEDFEAFFLTQMFEFMFQDVKTDGLFGGGQAEKIYRSMLFDEYGKMTARMGGIGVADAVMDHILQTQNQP